MFTLYGVTGPTFHGTLEQLYIVRGVTAARHVRAVEQEGVEPGVPGITLPPEAATYERIQHQHVDLERGPIYQAAQLMHAPVVTARMNDPVDRVWRLLAVRTIRQMPVLDVGGRLVGLVTDRDLLTALNVDADEVRDVLGKAVADVMRAPVIAAAPATDVRQLAHVMIDHRQSGVPIVGDNERLVGFVSRGDILRAVAAEPPLSLWA